MRICDSCQHSIRQHLKALDGYARPCLECSCGCFTDKQHRQACQPQGWGHNAEWHKDERVVVFRKPDGSLSYPMRSDKPLPQGWQKITLKSDREIARFERENNVLHHRRHFDSNGKGFDDAMGGRRV